MDSKIPGRFYVPGPCKTINFATQFITKIKRKVKELEHYCPGFPGMVFKASRNPAFCLANLMTSLNKLYDIREQSDRLDYLPKCLMTLF